MRIAVLCIALALGACRKESPPAPTAEQANQLNETENMLDEAARQDSNL